MAENKPRVLIADDDREIGQMLRDCIQPVTMSRGKTERCYAEEHSGEATSNDDPAWQRNLSQRERDVLGLLSTGQTDQEIAADLQVSVTTVRTHIRHILGKLGLKNRVQAAVLWDRYIRSRGH